MRGQLPLTPELYGLSVPRTGEMPSWIQQGESHQPHWPSPGGGRSAIMIVLLVPSTMAA